MWLWGQGKGDSLCLFFLPTGQQRPQQRPLDGGALYHSRDINSYFIQRSLIL